MAPMLAPVEAEAPSKPAGRPFQPSLFQPSSNVIPFEAYSPVEPRAKQPRAEGAPAKPRAPRRTKVPEGQQALEFMAPAPPKPRTLSTTVEAMIYCDAPVAAPLHRAVAAALDWSLVLIAYGMFLLGFHFMGGTIALDNKLNVAMFGGVLLVIACVYGLMWGWLGADSMGMRWTRLRLLTFDGFPPERKQRALRFIGSALGVSCVIGALWTFADEEGLGWQDYISKTFPTPQQADDLVLVRR